MHTSDTVPTQGVEGNTKTSTRRARGYRFTLNNYTDEEVKRLTMYGHSKTLKFVFGKEIAPTTGTPHLQGYIYHKNPVRFDHLKKLFPRCNWNDKCDGTATDQYLYCTKELTDVVHEGFEEKKTLKHAIKEKLISRYENTQWKPWQDKILNSLNEEPDSRTITWVFDPIGNSGKSYLTKYLALTREIIIADGKKDNIFNQVNRKLNEEEKEFDLVILDIPRSSAGYINYGVLEQLKNGLIYSGKYEGGLCLFDHVHVVVFANFEPDYSQFSEDRWNVISI